MKKIYLYITLTFILYKANAQEGNNWAVGYHGGINFSKDPPSHFSTAICQNATSSLNKNTDRTGSMSDCNGNLLFYTNGIDLWNRYHQLTPNGKGMNNYAGGNSGSNATIIPYPGLDSTYLIFSMHNYTNGVTVNKVKIQLDSGRGDIDTSYPIHYFSQKADFTSFEFKYIKQSDSLYWIINILKTKNVSTNWYTDSLLYCYRVDLNGLDTTPVVTTLSNGLQSLFLSTSNKGDKIAIYGHQDTYSGYKPFMAAITIYDFDKNTGRISNSQDILLTKYIYGSAALSGAFSPNDSFLYVNCDHNNALATASRLSRIIQVPIYNNNNNYYNVITSKNQYLGYLYLMPNNKILVWSNQCGVISFPNKSNKNCNYDSNYFSISNSDISSSPPPTYSPFISINYTSNTDSMTCISDSVHFYNNSDTGFLSFRWYFGDGDSLDAKDAVHFYKQAGKYLVTLSGLKNNCGYRLVRSDSIDVHYIPKIKINKKDVYICGAYKMQTTLQWKFADNIILHWGDGTDTLLYITNKYTLDSVILYHNYATGNYTISARVWNNTCEDSVAITNKVHIEPKLIANFNTNYTQSCGNSTITLTDSSGMDSIIQQRKWTIYYPNNIIKQYDTVTTNKLKLIVQDTGYYNAKLVYITRQGCIDSLYKTNVFRILPQPVVYIDSSAHNPLCYKDSFILTAKQKDMNYPPLIKYKWNMGQVSTQSIKVDTANSYYVSAWNTYGCGAQSNTVKISFLPQLFANVKTSKDSLYIIATRKIVSYTWYKDSVLYSTSSALIHPPTGRYYVKVVDGNGCVATSGSLLHTGLNHIEDIGSFIHVYPNPANDILYIDGLPNGKTSIVMYDMVGRSVLHMVCGDTNHGQVYSLSVRDLPKGLYILSVWGERVKVVVE